MVCCCCVCKLEQGMEDDVSFHKLPKDNEETKSKWVAFIGCTTGPNTKVCSKHFEDSDFIHKMHGKDIRRFLKTGAFPSVNTSRRNIEITRTDENTNTINLNMELSVASQDKSYESNKSEDTATNTERNMLPLKRRMENQVESDRNKRLHTLRYIGDLRREDFTSEKSWYIFQRYLTQNKSTIKCCNQKITRLNRKVENL